MNPDILAYNLKQSENDQAICERLALLMDEHLFEDQSKIWHGHPVWFIDGNPIAGYSKQKQGIRFMFWSGADFGEEALSVKGEKFKDASVFYNRFSEIEPEAVKRWLEKSKVIQWDYKNIVKKKGLLERL